MSYNWQFSVVWNPALLKAALFTVGLTVAICFFSTVVGLLLALGKRSPWKGVQYISKGYIEITRAVPPLVWLVWIYYAVPVLLGRGMDSIPTAIVALTIGGSPYLAEIIGAGIDAVPKGQYDAAQALGFTRMKTVYRIILPQAVRISLPTALNEYITILKLTSLASVIAVTEIFSTATTMISNSYRPLEIYTAIGLLYIALVLPLSWLAKRYQRTMRWSYA